MQPEIIESPEVREAEAAVQELVTLAESYQVTTVAEYETSADDLKRVKAAQKRLEDLRTSFTAPLNASLKAINSFFAGPKDRLAQAEGKIKRALIGFQQEQERLRRAEQAKAEEAARKEREKLAAQAAKAEAAGKPERAAELETRAAQVVAPVTQAAAPKVSGLTTRQVWRFEVTDSAAVPREFLVVDEKKIGQVVRAMKDSTNIPGVRVWAEDSLAAGAA